MNSCRSSQIRRRTAPVLAAACLLMTAPAGTARAEGDDRAIAEGLIAQLEPREHDREGDTARGRITGDALARARDARERATRLRRAGDEAHAKTADGLAREWAETGRDLARAADAEAAATELRRKAMAEQAQVERARALAEEGI